MREFTKVCERAARAGGRRLLELRGTARVREKGPGDLVTEADLASQEAIREVLGKAFPDHAFIGEEGTPRETGVSGPPAEYCWIVDPLDGTTNYVHGLDHFCVSVALRRGGEVLVGTVLDPVREECFSACLDGGAWLNGRRLAPSRVADLGAALIAASFPPRVRRGSAEVARFLEVLYRCQSMRRLGSAALNLCYIASGRLDAYWATNVRIWDVAAAGLIVHEAGGMLTDDRGGPFDLDRPVLAASATAELHRQLLAALAEADGWGTDRSAFSGRLG